MELKHNQVFFEPTMGNDKESYNADTVFGQKLYNLCVEASREFKFTFSHEQNYQFGTGFVFVGSQANISRVVYLLLGQLQKFINQVDDIYRNGMAISDADDRLDYLHQKFKIEMGSDNFSSSFEYDNLSEIKLGIDEGRAWLEKLGSLKLSE